MLKPPPLSSLLKLYTSKIKNDHDLYTRKNWDLSHLTPMAANLFFITYRCQNKNKTTYKVSLIHNEENIAFPIDTCKNPFFCSFKKVKNFYKKRLKNLVGNCSKKTWENYVIKLVLLFLLDNLKLLTVSNTF